MNEQRVIFAPGTGLSFGICAFMGLLLALSFQVETLIINDYTAKLSFIALPSVLLGITLTMVYNRVPAKLFDRPFITILGLILWVAGCLY